MSEFLTKISGELSDVVASAGKSIVRVDGRSRMHASGFVWSDGVIVTAHHVLERENNIQVGYGSDGETAEATLIGSDPSTDLAVLRVIGANLPAAVFAEPDSLRVGHLVLALGRPGKTVRATLGIVSALGESWQTRIGGNIDHYLQSDVVMYPGFSGGPLVDSLGRIVGLNTSALARSVSIAIPVPTIRRVVDTILEHGRVRRGYLGIGAQVAKLPERVATELGQDTGLLVVSVESGSAADNAGLVLGDTIVALDGEPMRHLDDLLSRLTGDTVGNTVAVKIVRGGAVQDVTATIGERA
jgi:S1-C subfamily serine protease